MKILKHTRKGSLPRVNTKVPMSALMQDNIKTHGIAWAAQYAAKRGLPLWMFLAFAGIPNRYGFN